MSDFLDPIFLIRFTIPKGGVAYISLTLEDVKCLDIALYFLSQQLHSESPHPLFVNFREDHYHHLHRWLHHPALKMNLEFLLKESLIWPLLSTEDAPWLMLAIEQGVIDPTLESLAADHARYECDMLSKGSVSAEEILSAVEKEKSFFSRYLKNYQQIAQVKEKLLAKLAQIENV